MCLVTQFHSGVWAGDALPPQDEENENAIKAERLDKRLALCCYGSPVCTECRARIALAAIEEHQELLE